jgi:hypothetical protein
MYPGAARRREISENLAAPQISCIYTQRGRQTPAIKAATSTAAALDRSRFGLPVHTPQQWGVWRCGGVCLILASARTVYIFVTGNDVRSTRFLANSFVAKDFYLE